MTDGQLTIFQLLRRGDNSVARYEWRYEKRGLRGICNQ